MVEYKTPGEIDAMHAAGQVVAAILAAVRAQAVPGVRLAELDDTAMDVLAEAGATSPFLGYLPAFARSPFGGHGIGHAMHEAPDIPNAGRAGRGPRLDPGLVIAIEPWFLAGGTDAYRIDRNGWTILSTDGSRAAHVEHTVAITEDGPRILTCPA
jgi:methionyl aminopeptidase